MLLCPYLIAAFLLPPSLLPVATLSLLHSHHHALITTLSSPSSHHTVTALPLLVSHHCSPVAMLFFLHPHCCFPIALLLSSPLLLCCTHHPLSAVLACDDL